jgi:hypothetical protein
MNPDMQAWYNADQAKQATHKAQETAYLNGEAPAPEYGKKQGAPPPNFIASAKDQSRLGAQMNRPNQTNAFGSSVNWTQDANGNWTQNQSFGGPMGGLFGNLQDQAAGSMGQPMDWNQFGKVGTGDDAANQAYAQMTSRLDPQWDQREKSLEAKLMNQGLDPNSEAAKNAMTRFGEDRNDAYGAARSQAFGLGRGVFQDNAMARQMAIAEALQKRGQPMQELLGMRGFMEQPGFHGVQGPNLLGANQAMTNYWLQKVANDEQMASDIFGGLFGGAGKAMGGFF